MKHRRIRLRLVVVALASGALWAASCASPAEERSGAPSGSGPQGAQAAVPSSDPIVTVGHGSIVLPGGKYVEPTPELVRSAQQYYLTRLRSEAGAALRLELDGFRQTLQANEGKTDEFATNARLIDWLLTRVQPSDATHLQAVNAFLGHALSAPAATDEGTPTRQALITPTLLSGPQYEEQCRSAGVPIPPKWGTSAWTPHGELKPVFISPTRDARVFVSVSDSPRGVCYALPRSAVDTDGVRKIDLLGVICQGSDTSKACFWDNPRKIGLNESFEIKDEFYGGADLFEKSGGICTECHRGENAFIIHPISQSYPEAALDIGDELLRPKGWVNPLVHPSWPQNRKPGRALQTLAFERSSPLSCGNCHSKVRGKRLGELGSEYCNAVIAPAVFGPTSTGANGPTMPPRSSSEPAKPETKQEADLVQWHREQAWELCQRGPIPSSTRFAEPRGVALAFGEGEHVAVGDFNGDGRGDVARLSTDGTLAVALQTSGGGFEPSAAWRGSLGPDAQSLQAGDFDGDDKDDLLLVTPNEVIVALAREANQAGFDVTSSWPLSGVVSASIADIDNDRRDDLVVYQGQGRASLYLSTGGGFRPGRDIDLGESTARTLLSGDVDGDGFADLVPISASFGATAPVLIGDLLQPGRFEAKALELPALAPEASPQLVDVDGDSLDDLIVIEGERVRVFRAGPAGFTEEPWWSPGLDARELTLGDVDGDGHADLIGIDRSAGRALISPAAP